MRNSSSTGTGTNRQRYRGTTQRTYIDGNTVRKEIKVTSLWMWGEISG